MSNIPAALAAEGTLLQIAQSGVSPAIYNTIANVGDITGPSISATVVDVTSHSSAAPWRQKIPTLLDPGTISVKLFFIPASDGSFGVPNTPFGHNGTNGLLSVFKARTLNPYAFVFTDGTTYFFNAYCTKFSQVAMVAGVYEATVEFTVTGTPDYV